MIDGLNPYPEYRDPGNGWLGDVPQHWDLRPAKRFFREVDDRSETGAEELLSVSHITGVTPRSQKNVTMFLASSYVGYKLCSPGDLVVNTMWAWAGALGIAPQSGIVSNAYAVYRPLPDSKLTHQYANRLLRTPVYVEEYHRHSTGLQASRLRLYPDAFLRLSILLPPADEQAAIVRFLDHADRLIRRYIAAKQNVITLLEEERRVTISTVVRRGLSRKVRLRSSGVDWIGDVPEHWQVLQLRRLSSLVTSGSRSWADYYSDDGSIFLQSGNLGRDMHLDLSRMQRVTTPPGAEGERTMVRQGDVLVCITGALTGNVALVDVDLNDPAFVNQHVALVRPTASVVRPEYLAFALHSDIGLEQFKSGEYGGTKQGLGLDDVRSAVIPLPPLPEQEAICHALSTRLDALWQMRSRAETETELARELRARLVADVVTGKLDVREAAASLPEPTETDGLR